MPDFTFGQSIPTRATSEGDLNRWNQGFRASPLYQEFMRSQGLGGDGHVRLSRGQQAALESALARSGMAIPSGMHIDQGGNLNQKNRLVRNTAIGAAATGAALTGLGMAGYGPMSGLFGAGTASAAGSTAVVPGFEFATALPAGMLPGGASLSTAFPAIAALEAPAVYGGGMTLKGLLNSSGFNTAATLGSNLLSNYMTNRANTNASQESLAFQLEALQRAEALQREMNAQRQANWEKTMKLAEEQYLAEQARLAPYRAAGTAALERLQQRSSAPSSAPYAYNPTFSYRG